MLVHARSVEIGTAGGTAPKALDKFKMQLRDTDTPDLGAHMVPLDFIFGWAHVTNSTILLTNGVAVGMFSPVASGAGLDLE